MNVTNIAISITVDDGKIFNILSLTTRGVFL